MNIQSRDQMIYQDAFQYLREHSKGLTDEILATYMDCTRVNSLDRAFEGVVNFVVDNYQTHKQVIIYNDNNNLDRIKKTFKQCDLNYFLETYAKAPDKLYNELYNTLTLRNAESDFSKWVLSIYVRVLCGMAKYLSRFQDAAALYQHIDTYVTIDQKIEMINEVIAASHAVKFCKGRNQAWGFALAANWLKDLGLEDYCKPDTHVKDFAKGLQICASGDDARVFRAMLEMAEHVKQTDPSACAFRLDRCAYLIGTGDYYNHKDIVTYDGSTKDFVQQELAKLP